MMNRLAQNPRRAYGPWMLFLLLAIGPVQSQNFEDGYVILPSQDTLYGQVKDRNNGSFFKKIRFKNAKGRVKRYGPEDILGYGQDGHRYVPKWFKEEGEGLRMYYYSRPGYGKHVFLKVIRADGPLHCYAREFMDEDSHFLQFELFQRQGEALMERATQGIFGLRKKRLSSYFRDCPTLVEKINSKEIRSYVEVVSFYNEHCGALPD